MENQPTVVSISGPKGAGKDTLSNTLEWAHFKRLSFSAPLKDAVAAIFGWDRSLLEGSTEEGRAWREEVDPYWESVIGDHHELVTPRTMLTEVGEGVRQLVHPDVWAAGLARQLMLLSAESPSPKDEKFVVSDTRHMNELIALHRLRGSHKVVMLNVFREILPWWGPFYAAVDESFKRTWGSSFVDLPSSVDEITLSHLASLARQAKPGQVHVSEVEFLVWPFYDATIDNSGDLKTTREYLPNTLAALGVSV
jgi:hypothetical protein